MAKDHEMLIANMKQNHADQVQDLSDQRAQLEEEQARALLACDEKYAELESLLRSSGSDGAARLLSVQDELKAQQEAYRKLQENLDTTQRNIVIRSRKGAADQIAHAAIGAKQSSMNTFLEVASQVSATHTAVVRSVGHNFAPSPTLIAPPIVHCFPHDTKKIRCATVRKRLRCSCKTIWRASTTSLMCESRRSPRV